MLKCLCENYGGSEQINDLESTENAFIPAKKVHFPLFSFLLSYFSVVFANNVASICFSCNGLLNATNKSFKMRM